MIKRSLFLFLFISLVFTFVNFAYSADQTAPSTTITPSQVGAKPVISTFQCPIGWQKKPNTTDLACVPAKPPAIKCPDGYQYYESLKCTAESFFGGCQARGCEIGCSKIEIPK